MVHLDEMRDFVGYHVVEEMNRHLYETPVQMDAAADVAASPTRAGARKVNLRALLHAERAPVMIDALPEARERLAVQPLLHAASDRSRAVDADDEIGAVYVHPGAIAGKLQRESAAQERERLSVDPAARWRAAHLPFLQLAHDPV